MWKYSCGGRGVTAPECNRRLERLTEFRNEYMKMFPDAVVFISAGVEQVPTEWINARLRETDEPWRIGDTIVDGEYVMPPLEEVGS